MIQVIPLFKVAKAHTIFHDTARAYQYLTSLVEAVKEPDDRLNRQELKNSLCMGLGIT